MIDHPHFLQSYSSTDSGATSLICPTQSGRLGPVLLEIQRKRSSYIPKALQQSKAPNHWSRGYPSCPCQEPLSLHCHRQGLQSQPALFSTLHPGLSNHRTHTEATGPILTESWNYKSAQSTSPSLQLQGKHAQRDNDLPRSRMGINGQPESNPGLLAPFASLFPARLPASQNPGYRRESITSLSQNKLLNEPTCHGGQPGCLQARLPFCCPVPASFSTDPDSSTVKTGVSWLVPQMPTW